MEWDDLVYRGKGEPELEPLALAKPDTFPGSDIPVPNWWTPEGIFGGIEMPQRHSSLELFMTPQQMADAGISTAAATSQGGGLKASPGLGPVDNGLDGTRPPAWDFPVSAPNTGQPPLTIDQVDPGKLVPGKPGGTYLGADPPYAPSTPIGQMPGYPETGKDVWRAELDDEFTDAASRYNATYGYKPGDPQYISPKFLKSWAMEESGGGRQVFEGDTLQANKPGDWDKHKADIGMSEGQAMTPQSSIEGGLSWLRYKATIHGGDGLPTGQLRPLPEALELYNGRKTIDSNGLSHYKNYMNSILGRIGTGHGDPWQ